MGNGEFWWELLVTVRYFYYLMHFYFQNFDIWKISINAYYRFIKNLLIMVYWIEKINGFVIDVRDKLQ